MKISCASSTKQITTVMLLLLAGFLLTGCSAATWGYPVLEETKETDSALTCEELAAEKDLAEEIQRIGIRDIDRRISGDSGSTGTGFSFGISFPDKRPGRSAAAANKRILRLNELAEEKNCPDNEELTSEESTSEESTSEPN